MLSCSSSISVYNITFRVVHSKQVFRFNSVHINAVSLYIQTSLCGYRDIAESGPWV